MSVYQQIDIGAATTDATGWAKLNAPDSQRGSEGGAQLARVFVRAAQAPAATFNIVFVLVDESSKVICAFEAVCTARTVITRDNLTQAASGNYLCDVAFVESGNSKIDLAGHGSASTGNTNAKSHWRVGVASYGSSNVTACTVNLVPVLDV